MSDLNELFESIIREDSWKGCEDAEKFKAWIPKIKKYRTDLENSIPQDLKIDLPKPINELISSQFNSIEYLYKEKLLTPRELEITDSESSQLIDQMSKGELSAVHVFQAFAKRAVIAHQFTNCAVEFFINDGLKRAKELDEYFFKHGKLVGPLHGLPVSLKEHLSMKGKIGHCGIVSLLDNICEDDAVTVKVLLKLGAVFYVRTNEPQSLLHLDSKNNITDLTKCPFNLLLSSGGSSSGEGAICAFGGSLMGVGSDIGGSIRSPAAFSGCCGLRPSSRRVSSRGIVGENGQESVVGVIGPLARRIDDIELFMKTYINEGKPWDLDPWALPIPWRSVPVPKIENLTIAVIRDDGVVRVSPPIRRGLDEVVENLKKGGAKIIGFDPPRGRLAYDVATKLSNADGNKELHEAFKASGEPLPKITKWYLNLGDGSRELSVTENRELNAIRDSLRQEYSDFLVNNNIDVILGPAYNNVAPQSEEVYNESYTLLYNLLDFPSLVFQTGLFQDPTIDKWTNDDLTYEYRSKMEELENRGYEPEKFVGAPIALQLSGRRYFDEEVVAIGKAITEYLNVDLLK